MTKKIHAVMKKVQDEIEPITKDATNPMYNKGYATIFKIMEVVGPILAKNNLVFTSKMDYRNDTWGVLSKIILIDEENSGPEEFEECFFPIVYNMGDAQQIGKSQTYARRYNLISLLNLSFVDDKDDNDGAPDGSPKKTVQKVSPNPIKVDL